MKQLYLDKRLISIESISIGLFKVLISRGHKDVLEIEGDQATIEAELIAVGYNKAFIKGVLYALKGLY